MKLDAKITIIFGFIFASLNFYAALEGLKYGAPTVCLNLVLGFMCLIGTLGILIVREKQSEGEKANV